MAHIPSDSDWQKIVRAVRLVLSPAFLHGIIVPLLPPPPDVEFLMKGENNISKGETGEMKFYAENSAGDWVDEGRDAVDVFAELGDYTADKKAYVKKIRGKLRILNTECG